MCMVKALSKYYLISFLLSILNNREGLWLTGFATIITLILNFIRPIVLKYREKVLNNRASQTYPMLQMCLIYQLLQKIIVPYIQLVTWILKHRYKNRHDSILQQLRPIPWCFNLLLIIWRIGIDPSRLKVLFCLANSRVSSKNRLRYLW